MAYNQGQRTHIARKNWVYSNNTLWYSGVIIFYAFCDYSNFKCQTQGWYYARSNNFLL